MKKQTQRLTGAVLAVLMLLSILPASAFAAETDSKVAAYKGKKVAVLGDSISTFIGISNNGAVNSTISNGAVFYFPGTNGVEAADTWWQQAADALGMELLVNNSWSGSAMFHPRAGTPGAYVERCVQLHNNHIGEEPDVIWIYLGTNDFSDYLGGAISWGTVEEMNTALITDNGDGTYTYAQPTTFLEAYAVALHKMHQRYPKAEIYCLGMLRRSVVSQKLTDSNNKLKKLVDALGYTYVDLESCIDPTLEDFRLSNGYDELHPAPEGMDRISQKVISAMLGEETKEYDVSYVLVNAEVQDAAKLAVEGGSFTAKLAPTGTYNGLNVIVTMGGKDVTAECCSKDGAVFIEEVTGDILVTAWGKNVPHAHEYDRVVTAPTCTEQGYTTYTCTTCGDSYVSDYTDSVGPAPGLVGDANCDGYVDTLDAMEILRYDAELAEGDELELGAADVNSDGYVDVLDAMEILRFDAELIGNDTWYRVNGVPLSAYTIVYAASDPDYTQRAAAYLRDEIAARTGLVLSVKSDQEQAEPFAHEIVVGQTNRAISDALDAKTEGLQFSLLADGGHVAMEGDYFVIAAAAYYFVDTYITEEPTVAAASEVKTVYEPIVEKAENYVFLIGDGMGFNQTQLFAAYSAGELDAYSDGEDTFYGYLLPCAGAARTNSLSGTTDSAAAGTALATGYKTINGYIGKDGDKNDVTSLTELAAELGKATAVMSTETRTGATPAAFSAHANSRNDTSDILASQNALQETHGTIILGDYGAQYDEDTIKNSVEHDLQNTLTLLSQNENGFFLMYEEAYIDKHSHSNERRNTFRAVLRLNQIIGCVMEYAFYNPETFVIITADHETGGLTKAGDGTYYYTTGNHTAADVPVFAYGVGAEVFDGVTVENIQIPKTLAKMWGSEIVGYDNENFPALALVN